MHICATCIQPCTCGGDTSPTLSGAITCNCCPARCEHGIEIDAPCDQCLLEHSPVAQVLEEETPPEPAPAFMNGGW